MESQKSAFRRGSDSKPILKEPTLKDYYYSNFNVIFLFVFIQNLMKITVTKLYLLYVMKFKLDGGPHIGYLCDIAFLKHQRQKVSHNSIFVN